MTSTQPTDLDFATRLDRAEAHEAIRRVIHEFSHGFDKRDIDRLLATLHPDAVWLVAPGYEASGHEGVRVVAEQSWGQMASTHHWTCNTVIDLDGDRATGTVDVNALAQTREGSWHQSAATYSDRYVRLGGRWLIERREAAIHATVNLAQAGAEHPWGDISEH